LAAAVNGWAQDLVMPFKGNEVWQPIGCMYGSHEDQALTPDRVFASFDGGIFVQDLNRKVSEQVLRLEVNKVASDVGLQPIGLTYTNVRNYKAAAFKQKASPLHNGSVVIGLSFLTEILSRKNGLHFFRAIVGHEIGHFLVHYNKEPVPITVAPRFLYASRIDEDGFTDLTRAMYRSPEYSKGSSSYDVNSIKKRFGGKFVEINAKLKKELVCDFWAGVIFQSFSNDNLTGSFAERRSEWEGIVRSLIVHWRDLGQNAKIADQGHGAPLTRGLMFAAGTANLGIMLGNTANIEIVAFDDKGFLISWSRYKNNGHGFLRLHRQP
jgi:hypothetical protein